MVLSVAAEGGYQAPAGSEPDYTAEARFDFDGDGQPDTFCLEVRKERDFTYYPATKATSKEKFLWYRSRLVIRSGADDHLLLKDEWSIKESDMDSFRLRLGDISPEEYFAQFFKGLTEPCATFSTAYFETGKLEEAEINPEALKYSLREAKIPEERWSDIQKEILEYPEARLLYYRGDWAEDLRWVVYVKSLKRGIHYYFGYPM